MSDEETADLNFMRAAVMEARKGLGHTRPNPPVGAVIVKDGRIIGKGYHHTCGCDHAEVDAIKNACRRKNDTTGATIYVTLEPCSKSGRVGACTDAIIAAGLARVVYGAVDPNPTNCGKAKRALARRGIACERLDPRSSQAALCRDLIRRFRKHVTTGLPYVTVKLAMSLDGKICDDDGDARWISSAAARKRTGALREQVDAIMVGGETVRRDNPSLLSHGKRNDDLVRVIVSKSGKLPKTAQVFTDGAPNKTLVFDDAKKALVELGRMGLSHVLCEGGLKLAVSLAEAGLVDEWITVLSPVVIGNRPIAKAIRPFTPQDERLLGPDILCHFSVGPAE